MKFSVNQVAILSSQTGDGLKIGDKIMGCAIITDIEMEKGTTLEEYVKKGMIATWKDNRVLHKKDDPDYELKDETKPAIWLDMSALRPEDCTVSAPNYVLFVKDTVTNEVSVILNTLDITQVFGLPDEDAVNMDKHLGGLAMQKGLCLVRYTDLRTDTESFFFTNQFDREVNDALLLDEVDDAVRSVNAAKDNPDYWSQLVSDNFIKLCLMAVVQTGQARYNKLNKEKAIEQAAEILSNITYWEDGVLYKPSVKDINQYLEDVSGNIRIG